MTRWDVSGVEVATDLHDFEFEVVHVFVAESPAFESFDDVVDAFGEGGGDSVGEVVLERIPAVFEVLVPFHQRHEALLPNPLADFVEDGFRVFLRGLVKERQHSFFN